MPNKDSTVSGLVRCFNCEDSGSMMLWKNVEGQVKAGYWPSHGEDGEWVVVPCVYCRDLDYWTRR